MFAIRRLAVAAPALRRTVLPQSCSQRSVHSVWWRHQAMGCRALSSKAEPEEPVVVEAEKVVSVEDASEEKDAKKVYAEQVGTAESLEFQAETKRILEIVAGSLYQDKEVFVREIVSNASDALEKRRMAGLQDESAGADNELHIAITADKKENTFTIRDNGVGMTRDELVSNLGTIARSGSKAFMEEKGKDADAIIGQFGVGFYSVFMVADEVKVYSRSAEAEDGVGHIWSSDGSGKYSIAEAKGIEVGTTIVMSMKENQKDFSKSKTIEEIIKKYSSFVSFPIYVNDKRANTVPAIWTKMAKDVTDEEHDEFFKFICNSYGSPMYKFQFQTDMPLHIQSVFYIPMSHTERMGGSVMDSGVSLYTRSVMIQPKGADLLPKWMRFVKGVIESDDVPVNLSREFMQDSKLVNKVSKIAAKRLLNFMKNEAKRDPAQYKVFYGEFNKFLKEGVCTDIPNQQAIAELLRFDSSKAEDDIPVSLAEYVERMGEDEKNIYYLSASNRAIAEKSPYYERFKKQNKEVLFFYDAVDDVVASHLQDYKKKTMMPVEEAQFEDDEIDASVTEANKELCAFIEEILGDKKVTAVELSSGLTDSPAVITGHQRAAMRNIMRMISENGMPSGMEVPPKFEINPDHSIIKALGAKMHTDRETAEIVVEQLYDNAMVSAGLIDDPRQMVSKLNTLLDRILAVEKNVDSDAPIVAEKVEESKAN